MKVFAEEWQDELDAGRGMRCMALEILCDDPFRVWSGYGDIVLAGETYHGIGAVGMIKATGSQIGGSEQAIEGVLSGVDPAVIPIIATSGVRGARVKIWRLGFDPSGQVLLNASIYARGRVDSMPREDKPGDTATIRCMVETAARGMGRQTGRMTADADQRLIDAADGSHKRVSQAAELTLAWGGKPPARAGSSIPTTIRFGPGGIFDFHGIQIS